VQLQVANHAFGHAACALSAANVPDLPDTTVYLSSALKPGDDLAAAAAASRTVTVDVAKFSIAHRWFVSNSLAFGNHPEAPPDANVDDNGIVRGSFYIAPNRPMFAFQDLARCLGDAAAVSLEDANQVFTQSSLQDYRVYAHCHRVGWPCTTPADLPRLVKGVIDGVKDSSCLNEGEPSKSSWAAWCRRNRPVFHDQPPPEPAPTSATFTADVANACRVPDSGNDAECSPTNDVASFTKATESGHGRATLLTDTMQPVAPTVDGINAATDGARYSVVYANDGHLYESWNTANIVAAFPQLFPYGRGHPSEDRELPISLRAYVKHSLCLSSQAFAESDDYIFQMFDTLNKSEAHGALGATLRANPCGTAQASTITVEELTLAANHATAVSKALRAGKPPPPPPTSGAALRLLHAIRTSNSKLFGTVEHALNNRAKLFALEHAFGAHAIWSTTSPDDLADTKLIDHVKQSDRHTAPTRSHSPVGSQSPRGVTSPSAAPTAFELPTAERLRAAAASDALAVCQNSGTTAWHFDQAMQILTKDLYRFNQHDGIFGHCTAYAGMTEEQKRLSLHMHTCLFVKGMPCTVNALTKKLRNKKQHELLTEYINVVETAEHPLAAADVDQALSQTTHTCLPRVDTTRITKIVLDAQGSDEGAFDALARFLNDPDNHQNAPSTNDKHFDNGNGDAGPPNGGVPPHNTSSNNDVLPVPHSYRCLTEPRPNLPHPPNVQCNDCHEIHASTHHVFKQWALQHCGHRAHYEKHGHLPETAEIDMHAAVDSCSNIPASTQARACLTIILLDKMVHTPGHRKGCFSRKDNAKKQTCRFKRPVVDGAGTSGASIRINGKHACTCAHTDECTRPDHYAITLLSDALDYYESIEVVVKRAHGNEYVSNYNTYHFAVFRCNTNTRVVCANPGQIYYTTSYATKVPDSRDATAKMVTTLQYAIERHKQSDKSAVSKGTSVAFSLFNAFSSTMEIPSTMAALWLLRPNLGVNYYSHDFVNVNLKALLAHVNAAPLAMYHHAPGSQPKPKHTRAESTWRNLFDDRQSPPMPSNQETPAVTTTMLPQPTTVARSSRGRPTSWTTNTDLKLNSTFPSTHT